MGKVTWGTENEGRRRETSRIGLISSYKKPYLTSEALPLEKGRPRKWYLYDRI